MMSSESEENEVVFLIVLADTRQRLSQATYMRCTTRRYACKLLSCSHRVVTNSENSLDGEVQDV